MSKTRAVGLAIKRLVDVVGATAGLIVLAPVMGGATVAILVSMGRPVLFWQERPGLDGRIFRMCKFRTMRPPKEGEVYYRTDAERLTAVGRFLRQTSIDELPELLLVLKGDMSLVGPRPLLKEYLPLYDAVQGRRHEMRPGITGWAQVHGRQSIPFSRRLALDVEYVDRWSLKLDAEILWKTVVDAFGGEGVISGQNVDDVDDLGFTAATRGASRVPAR